VAEGTNPRDIKVRFAQEIVARFHSPLAAEQALQNFELRSKGGIPDEIPELDIILSQDSISIGQLLKQANLVSSTSEAIRMIEQGGVRLDGERVEDKALQLGKAMSVVAQVGKRKFARIHLK
jgi:tyrosyl-tRNA synthetase